MPGPKSPPPKKGAIKKSPAEKSHIATPTDVRDALPANNGGVVRIEKSFTKNLENYESAKITIGVSLPVSPSAADLKDVQKTIEILNEIVDAEMENQIGQIEEARK